MNKSRFLLIPLMLFSSSYSAAETASELQSRVSKLERMAENRGLLNLLDEVHILQKEVTELRGQVEQQAYTIEQMKKRNKNLYDDLDQRLQGGASTQVEQTVQVIDANSAATAPQVSESAEPKPVAVLEQSIQRAEVQVTSGAASENVTSTIKPIETYVAKSSSNSASTTTIKPVQSDDSQASASAASTGMSAEESYSEAFNLLKLGKNDLAVNKFRSFLENYPSSQYADNSQYWLGEAYYAKRDFDSAVKEYKLLLSNYPESGKVSHAQLKLGYSYNEMGQDDFAQGELEDLIARYPGTSAARLAEERLVQIRSH